MVRTRHILGRFYTPPEVAGSLIAMADIRPTSILDLGCGLGALSLAAVERWGAALRLVTLDVDPEAGPGTGAWADDHQHLLVDLLAESPGARLVAAGAFDVALLNPPYGRSAAVASDPGVSDAPPPCLPLTRCRATIFMMHALRSVRVNGLVAAILPETIATGIGSMTSRMLITSHGEIERIAMLPARTFAGTEARTAMTVMRRTPVRNGRPFPWWTETECRGDGATETLGDLGVDVVRGRLSTAEARNAGAFHLNHFKAARDGIIRLPDGHGSVADDRAARAGDILVARIGRNIADKVARVAAGSSMISDCVYRLRCHPTVADRVWRGLRSVGGKQQMEAALSGVTTRNLPMCSLLTLRV